MRLPCVLGPAHCQFTTVELPYQQAREQLDCHLRYAHPQPGPTRSPAGCWTLQRLPGPGEQQEPAVPLDRGRGVVTLGRGMGADLQCSQDPRLSRLHLQLLPAVSGPGWAVQDLGSRAGTWLNTQRLAGLGRVELRPGDLLGLATSPDQQQAGQYVFRVCGPGREEKREEEEENSTPPSTPLYTPPSTSPSTSPAPTIRGMKQEEWVTELQDVKTTSYIDEFVDVKEEIFVDEPNFCCDDQDSENSVIEQIARQRSLLPPPRMQTKQQYLEYTRLSMQITRERRRAAENRGSTLGKFESEPKVDTTRLGIEELIQQRRRLQPQSNEYARLSMAILRERKRGAFPRRGRGRPRAVPAEDSPTPHRNIKECFVKIRKNVFVCETCGFHCSTNSSLMCHIQINHIEIRYICNFCEHQASNKEDLENHQAAHIAQGSGLEREDFDFEVENENNGLDNEDSEAEKENIGLDNEDFDAEKEHTESLGDRSDDSSSQGYDSNNHYSKLSIEELIQQRRLLQSQSKEYVRLSVAILRKRKRGGFPRPRADSSPAPHPDIKQTEGKHESESAEEYGRSNCNKTPTESNNDDDHIDAKLRPKFKSGLFKKGSKMFARAKKICEPLGVDVDNLTSLQCPLAFASAPVSSSCFKILKSIRRLLYHLRVTHGEKFQCDICTMTFFKKHAKLVHEQRIHQIDHGLQEKVKSEKESEFECSHCDYTAKKLSTIKVHIEQKHSGKEIPYYECNWPGCKHKGRFSCKESLVSHENFIHKGIKFSCEEEGCTFAGRSRHSLSLHIEFKHREGPVMYCRMCQFKAKDQRRMDEHFRNKHENQPELTFICDQCSKTFNAKRALQKHISNAHTEGIKHRCNQCEFATKHRKRLQLHIEKVHEGRKWICDICGSNLSCQGMLKRHMDEVHGNVEFKCDTCDYKAKSAQRLKVHIEAVHLGIKHYCDECGYSTLRQTRLRLHKNIEHRGIRYPCTLCDYVATRKYYLNQHMKSTKHGGPGLVWTYKGGKKRKLNKVSHKHR